MLGRINYLISDYRLMYRVEGWDEFESLRTKEMGLSVMFAELAEHTPGFPVAASACRKI